MIQLIRTENGIGLESQILIGEDVANVIKTSDTVKEVLRDLHLAHRLEEDDDKITSIAGREIGNHLSVAQIEQACEKLEHDHIELIDVIDCVRKAREVNWGRFEEFFHHLLAGLDGHVVPVIVLV